MILPLAVTFIVGVAVGTFLGMMGLSLCFIGKRTDGMVDPDAPRCDAQP